MTRHCIGAFCVLAAAAGLGEPVAAAPAWTPDPALLGRLATPQMAEGFAVRPPHGYVKQPMSKDGDRFREWTGIARPGGGRPLLMAERVVPPPAGAKDTLGQAFAGFMNPHVRRYRGWTVTPTEAGTLGGLPFVRCYWRGTDPQTGRRRAGFNYMGRQGGVFFLLGAEDTVPGGAQALALAEASVLTFQAERQGDRKKAPRPNSGEQYRGQH